MSVDYRTIVPPLATSCLTGWPTSEAGPPSEPSTNPAISISTYSNYITIVYDASTIGDFYSYFTYTVYN